MKRGGDRTLNTRDGMKPNMQRGGADPDVRPFLTQPGPWLHRRQSVTFHKFLDTMPGKLPPTDAFGPEDG
jgi:hypothetical protein